VVFFGFTTHFAFRHENNLQSGSMISDGAISISISGEGCRTLDQKMSRMTQVLSQTSTMLAHVAHLEIKVDDLWQDGMGEIAWLELLRPFTAVKTLRVPELLAGSVALALEGIIGGETGIRMLPCVAQRTTW